LFVEFLFNSINLNYCVRTDVSFCDNTVGHGLEHIGIEALEEELTRAPKTLKRNKVFRDTIGGLHTVALDGTEFYRSTSIHCNECLRYRVKTKDGSVTHYVHRIVAAQKVATSVKPVLACEKILPNDTQIKEDKTPGHEGELTAAKRQRKSLSYMVLVLLMFLLLTLYT